FMKPIFKIMTILALLALVVIIFLLYYLSPKEINKSFEGIVYRIGSENSNYEEKVSVSVKGTLKNNLFEATTFKGAITIDGTEESLKFHRSDLSIEFEHSFIGKNGGLLFYYGSSRYGT